LKSGGQGNRLIRLHQKGEKKRRAPIPKDEGTGDRVPNNLEAREGGKGISRSFDKKGRRSGPERRPGKKEIPIKHIRL